MWFFFMMKLYIAINNKAVPFLNLSSHGATCNPVSEIMFNL